jgi:hypothetical protein
MSILLSRKKHEEILRIARCPRESHRTFEIWIDRPSCVLEVKTWLLPAIFQKKAIKRTVYLERKLPVDDTVSRAAIWKALFKDKPLPNIEEDAVEKYAGLLDEYLPSDIPVDDVVRHAKG